MFSAMHFIYYINRSIATKVDSTYLGTQRICLVARGGRELVTFRSQSPTLSLYTTHVDLKVGRNPAILWPLYLIHSFTSLKVEPVS